MTALATFLATAKRIEGLLGDIPRARALPDTAASSASDVEIRPYRRLPLDREVFELHRSLTVLDDVRHRAAAGHHLRIGQARIDDETPVNLLYGHGEVPLQPQQIEIEHASALRHNRQDGGRLRSESQTEAA